MPYAVFSIPTGAHLYDRGKDTLVKLTNEEYQNFLVGSTVEAEKRLRNKGLCEPSHIEEIEHPDTSRLEYFLANQLQDIVLQVTQNCNLRCDYCAYSGKYHNRIHANKRMSFSTAKQAIDFAISHSGFSRELAIGFYGGEPLLEFELIKQIVAYIKEVYPEKNVRYGLTTNATLLTDEVAHFFQENDFQVVISIDGPKEIHDLQRRFANGHGSFDVVMENLSRVKGKYNSLYQRCRTNTVLTPENDYKCISEFFSTDTILSEMNATLSLISDIGIRETVTYDEAVLINRRQEQMKSLLAMLGEINSNSTSKMNDKYKWDLVYFYQSLGMGNPEMKKGHPAGPCLPGVRKTFIDVHGNIFPCEKVVETEEMKIGTLETGFDIGKAASLLNVGKTTGENCKNCWAFYHCASCIAGSIDAEKVSSQRRLKRCDSIKANVLENLKDIAFLLDCSVDFERMR